MGFIQHLTGQLDSGAEMRQQTLTTVNGDAEIEQRAEQRTGVPLSCPHASLT